MIVTYSDDLRATTTLLPDSTAKILLADTGEMEIKTLESLLVSCDATPTTFSLYLRKNSIDYPILNDIAMAANAVYLLTDHHVVFRRGQELWVKAGAANHLCVVAVTINGSSKKDNRGSPAK